MFDVESLCTMNTCTQLSSEIHTSVLQSPFWLVPPARREPHVKAAPSRILKDMPPYSPTAYHLLKFSNLENRSPNRKPYGAQKLMKLLYLLMMKMKYHWYLFPQDDVCIPGTLRSTPLPSMSVWSQIRWVYFRLISVQLRACNRPDLLNHAHMYAAGTMSRVTICF